MSTISVPFHRLAVNTPTIELVGYATGNGGLSVTVSAGTWSGSSTVDSYGRFSASVPVSVGENTIQATVTDGGGQTASWSGTVVRLITDREQADLDLLEDLLAAPMEDWTEAELAEFNLARSRGAYNYTDLNRVSAAAELVYQSLIEQGFVVDYAPVTHERPQPGGLPYGYTELEYIESSGTQYIDTGFKPNQNSRIVIKFQLLSAPSTTWIFGARNSNTDATMGVFWYTNTTTWCADYDGNSQRYNFPSSIGATDLIFVDYNKNTISLNDNNHIFSERTFQNANTLAMLAISTAGTITNFARAKLFQCAIYDNDTLIRDYVPCKTENAEVGLYDLVNGIFYGNSGTGTFSAGPDVPNQNIQDPYSWYEEDTPTQMQMDQYLGNVTNLLESRLVQEQVTLPEAIDALTLEGANNIELALVSVDAVTPVARKSYIYSGEAMAGEF